MTINKRRETEASVVVDLFAINLAWFLYYLVRVRSGWVNVPIEPELWLPMAAVYVFWGIVFFLVGLYRPWYAKSRFDEVALLFKTTGMGCLFLFFVVFVDDEGSSVGTSTRVLIAIYWVVLLGCVVTARLMLRSLQRKMLIAGIGMHNTLIVGSAARSRHLFDRVIRYPALGYKVKGFVRLERGRRGQKERGVPLLGAVDDLSSIIARHEIREVLIALDSKDHSQLLEIVSKCNGHPIGLKIEPDLYDIISGQARTNQIYGFPLIEISPQLMSPWEEAVKRMIDVSVAILILVVGFPFWVLIAAAVRIESPGSILYKQERVGKDGERFNIIKFRSMYNDAERSGPQWAHRRDPRVTHVGWLLRKLHLDEVPQMVNILKGHMSLVGPRPERPVFVEKLSREIPMYPRRLKVRPGITGWAQVKQTYDETIDDVRKKIQYDLFYIENMSLRMDLKIILSTAYHMLLGRGR